MSDAGRTLRSNSVISVLGTALSAALSMLYVSLGARWLGPVEFGSVGALVAVSNVLQLTLGPLEAGLTLRVARLVGEERFSELGTFARSTLRALFVSAGSLLLVWWLSALSLRDSHSAYPLGAVQWLGAFCAAGLVSCLPRAVLRGRERFYALSENAVIESGLRLALGLVLIKLNAGASSMLAAYAVGGGVAVAHGALAMRRGLPVHAAATARAGTTLRALVAPFRALTAPLLFVHAYAALMVNLDVLVAKHYLPAREAGLYAGATSLSRIVAVGATPLLLVLFSRLATLSAARRNTQRTLRLGASAIGLGLFLSLLVPAFFGDVLLRLVLGEAYEGASAVLFYQWACACVVTLQVFFADAMLATSELRAPSVLLLPAALSFGGFALFHDSALVIAQVSLGVAASAGSLALYALFRLRAQRPAITP